MGGTRRQLVALIAGLVSRGFRCKVWVLDDAPGASADEVRRSGATVEGIFTEMRLVGTACRLVYRAIAVPALVLAARLRRDRPQVLQCFHDEANVIGALAGRLAGVPVVVLGLRSVHPRDQAWTGDAHWRNPYDRLDPRLVDALIVNSEAGRLSFSRFEPLFPGENIHVVPNCVVPPKRGYAPLTHRPQGAPVVLWMARVAPEKRPDLFVGLLARLVALRVPFEAWVAGEGKELGPMKALAGEAGLSKQIRFLGTMHTVGDLLNAASVLVLCSDVEGLPNSILEAQHAGCPVVATAVGGVPELIVDRVNGLLVPRGDVEALAARVSEVLSDSDLARRLGSGGRNSVVGRFSQQGMVDGTLKVYGLAETPGTRST